MLTVREVLKVLVEVEDSTLGKRAEVLFGDAATLPKIVDDKHVFNFLVFYYPDQKEKLENGYIKECIDSWKRAFSKWRIIYVDVTKCLHLCNFTKICYETGKLDYATDPLRPLFIYFLNSGIYCDWDVYLADNASQTLPIKRPYFVGKDNKNNLASGQFIWNQVARSNVNFLKWFWKYNKLTDWQTCSDVTVLREAIKEKKVLIEGVNVDQTTSHFGRITKPIFEGKKYTYSVDRRLLDKELVTTFSKESLPAFIKYISEKQLIGKLTSNYKEAESYILFSDNRRYESENKGNDFLHQQVKRMNVIVEEYTGLSGRYTVEDASNMPIKEDNDNPIYNFFIFTFKDDAPDYLQTGYRKLCIDSWKKAFPKWRLIYVSVEECRKFCHWTDIAYERKSYPTDPLRPLILAYFNNAIYCDQDVYITSDARKVLAFNALCGVGQYCCSGTFVWNRFKGNDEFLKWYHLYDDLNDPKDEYTDVHVLLSGITDGLVNIPEINTEHVCNHLAGLWLAIRDNNKYCISDEIIPDIEMTCSFNKESKEAFLQYIEDKSIAHPEYKELYTEDLKEAERFIYFVD